MYVKTNQLRNCSFKFIVIQKYSSFDNLHKSHILGLRRVFFFATYLCQFDVFYPICTINVKIMRYFVCPLKLSYLRACQWESAQKIPFSKIWALKPCYRLDSIINRMLELCQTLPCMTVSPKFWLLIHHYREPVYYSLCMLNNIETGTSLLKSALCLKTYRKPWTKYL